MSGAGMSRVGADDVVNLVDELARDSFELLDAELARVDGDAALGAAVGQIDDGRFPGHERGQGADFVEIDFGVIAQAALHGAAGVVVLHAVADEGFEAAVVHLDGNLHLDLAAWEPRAGGGGPGSARAGRRRGRNRAGRRLGFHGVEGSRSEGSGFGVRGSDWSRWSREARGRIEFYRLDAGGDGQLRVIDTRICAAGPHGVRGLLWRSFPRRNAGDRLKW